MGIDGKRIAVIIPAWLQSASLLKQFQLNLRTFHHDAIDRIIVICNRLSLMSEDALANVLHKESPIPIVILHDKERSVAGAWNRGIELAHAAGLNLYLITATDVAFLPGMLDHLLEFGEKFKDCDLWSSSPMGETFHESVPISENLADTCDFSCFMLRYKTIERHGWFDKEFSPAYFEDNDFLTRLVLSGSTPKMVLRAHHEHATSLTVKLDQERLLTIRQTFCINELRFKRKWGYKATDYSIIRAKCFSTPFNTGRPLHWWPEQDNYGYRASGGTFE
jgi:GT2 family glycosyltransferase